MGAVFQKGRLALLTGLGRGPVGRCAQAKAPLFVGFAVDHAVRVALNFACFFHLPDDAAGDVVVVKARFHAVNGAFVFFEFDEQPFAVRQGKAAGRCGSLHAGPGNETDSVTVSTGLPAQSLAFLPLQSGPEQIQGRRLAPVSGANSGPRKRPHRTV